jgi:hypothetical protein
MSKIEDYNNKVEYEGFPYLTYIHSHIQKQLNARQIPTHRINVKTAWIKATSGVRILGSNAFKILSSVEQDENDHTKFTFNDLYKTEDEYRPIPGITSINVDYMSKYGGVRKASIFWKANSRSQLERLSPYFLNPGRSVLLEWGWENDLYFYNIKNLELLTQTKESWKIFYDRSLESNGNYDGMLGIIVNNDVSLRQDGGYDIVTEVFSGGSLMYGVNLINQMNIKGANPNDDKLYKETIRSYIENGQLDVDVKNAILGNSSLRYDSYCVTDGGKTFYSWGFIEDKIVSQNLGVEYKDKATKLFKLDSRDKANFLKDKEIQQQGTGITLLDEQVVLPSAKISNHSELRTTNLEVCIIPNNNKYSDILSFEGINEETKETDPSVGYIRHILVNEERVKETFLNNDTLSDALLSLLNQINSACINFWDFSLKMSEPTQEMRVIDANYVTTSLKKLIDSENDNESQQELLKKIYVFETHGGNGIIKNCSFNTKLNDMIAITSIYGQNKSTDDSDKIIVNSDNDSFINIWSDSKVKYEDYFIGTLAYNTNETNIKENISQDNKIKEGKRLREEKQNSDFSEKFKNFLPPPDSTENDDINAMRKRVYGIAGVDGKNAKSEAIVPAEFEISIEGIAGLRIGDIFFMDAVPDIYLRYSVFQITSISQSINSNYWLTSIKAIMRVYDHNFHPAAIRSGNIKAKGLKKRDEKIADVVAKDFYFSQKTNKTQIVLHHTAGGGNGKGVITDWNNRKHRHVGTAFIVNKNGSIENAFNPEYWAYHTGKGINSSRNSIGIEIINWGWITKNSEGNYFRYTGGKVPKGTKLYNFSWRGYDYYEMYTRQQFIATVKLVKRLCKQFNIPRNIITNYDFNGNLVNHNGIISHCNIRTDKWDISPAFNILLFNQLVQDEITENSINENLNLSNIVLT